MRTWRWDLISCPRAHRSESACISGYDCWKASDFKPLSPEAVEWWGVQAPGQALRRVTCHVGGPLPTASLSWPPTGLAWAQPPLPQACSPELQNLFPFFQGVAVFGKKAAGHLLAHGQGLRRGWETPTKGIPSPLETLDYQAQEILLQAASASPPQAGCSP